MSEMTATEKGRATVVRLGCVDYDKAHSLQLELVDKRAKGEIDDTFLFVTHPPTITVGRGSHSENLLCSDEALAKRGVRKYDIERGGDVTFHGSGQQVIYPVIDLTQRGRDLHKFMRDLESVVIDCLSNYDIKGESIAGKSGVWVGEKKICAIGIAVRRWVSFHGLALNLNIDLSYFQLINPCGFSPDSVTSLQALTGRAIDEQQAFHQLVNSIEKIFDLELTL